MTISRANSTGKIAQIAVVVPLLDHSGGISQVADFIVRTIERTGFLKVHLVSLATSAADPESARLLSPSTWISSPKTRDGLWRGRSYTHVGAWLAELEFQRYQQRKVIANAIADCDLVQVVCGSPAWALSVCGLGKPVAVLCATRAVVERRRRDYRPQGPAGWWRKAMTAVTNRLDDSALRKVDAIQVMNPWMLDYARTINVGRSDVDIRYAPPGVDAAMFHPLCERMPAQDPYILCVGRLDDPRKNIGLLLEAFDRLPLALGRVNLVTAGSGEPPPSYWDRVRMLGLGDRVRHVARPSTEELVALYQRATAFALPSDEEGFGVVILEAMACGVPVVSTRSGGPDGIIADGEDGFLVPLNDSGSLADRLTRLCMDEEMNRAMGQRGRVTIEQRYAEVIAANTFLDIWERMLPKAQRKAVRTLSSHEGQGAIL